MGRSGFSEGQVAVLMQQLLRSGSPDCIGARVVRACRARVSCAGFVAVEMPCDDGDIWRCRPFLGGRSGTGHDLVQINILKTCTCPQDSAGLAFVGAVVGTFRLPVSLRRWSGTMSCCFSFLAMTWGVRTRDFTGSLPELLEPELDAPYGCNFF